MKKQLTTALFLLLSLTAVAAADFSEYPQQFITNGNFNGQIVVGGDNAPATDALAATEIAVTLQQYSSSRITAKTESEFDASVNAILIGLPCQNSAIANILGTTSCDIGLAEGTGYLKFVEKNGNIFLIVTGKTAADTRRAARVLAKFDNFALTGNETTVTGSLDSPKTQAAQPPQPKPAATPDCTTNNDCAADKWCLAGKCAELGCPEGTKAENHDCTSIKEEKKTEAAKEPPSAVAATKETPPAQQSKNEPPEPKKGFFEKLVSFFKSVFS